MNKVIKYSNILIQLLVIILPLLWVFNIYDNDIANKIVNIMVILVIAFTVFISLKMNMLKKVYFRYTLMIIGMILATFVMCTLTGDSSFDKVVELFTMIILPLSILTIDEYRISDRIYGLLIIIIGLISFLGIGDQEVLHHLAFILAPLTFVVIYKDNNLILKIIYVIANLFILSILFQEQYIIILISLLELVIAVIDDKKKYSGTEYTYMLLFAIAVVLIVLEYILPIIPITFIMSTYANKGFIKEKISLLFTANDLSVGGIETSLVNLLNRINKHKYEITLILENKKGKYLEEVSKKVYIRRYKVYNFRPAIISRIFNLTKRIIYSIFNYNTYDFSCCYATYSYCGNKLAKISSRNSSIWVHSNYRYVYKRLEDTISFFETRKMNEFRKIIFVSNEARDDYLELFPNHKNKTMVVNNFINIDLIHDKKKEKTGVIRAKNKLLFVFVGRLEEESKKITRIIDLAKNIDEISVWLIGDGKDKEMYQKLIKDNKLEKKIQMLGSIKDPYNYMARADYIILTSDYEGFPVVYLEALALNKEIITTIPVSAGKIDMKERAHIISKDNYIEDVRKILKEKKIKNAEINLKEIQHERIRRLEKLFDGVI